MDIKDISTQVNFDSELALVDSGCETSQAKSLKDIARFREKKNFQIKGMKIDKLLLSSFQSSSKNSMKLITSGSKILNQVRIQIASTKNLSSKKQFPDFSCQGRKLYVFKNEDSFSNRNLAGPIANRRKSQVGSRKKINTVELLQKFTEVAPASKSFREPKLSSKDSHKKFEYAKVKYLELKNLMQIPSA